MAKDLPNGVFRRSCVLDPSAWPSQGLILSEGGVSASIPNPGLISMTPPGERKLDRERRAAATHDIESGNRGLPS